MTQFFRHLMHPGRGGHLNALLILGGLLTGLFSAVPVQAEVQCDAQQLNFQIPFQWSRSPSEEERSNIRHTLDTSISLAFLRNGEDDWQTTSDHIHVSHALLLGYSSPESNAGANSLRPDQIDTVNIRVALKRAKVLETPLLELLAPLGLTPDSIHLEGTENQFRPYEWDLLLQNSEKGAAPPADTEEHAVDVSDEVAIFNLIRRYKQQRSSLTDAQRKAVASTLVDKKAVQVTVCYQSTRDSSELNPQTEGALSVQVPVNPIMQEVERKTTEPPPSSAIQTAEPGKNTKALRELLNVYGLWLGMGLGTVLILLFTIYYLSRRATAIRVRSEALPRRNRRPWNAPNARILAVMSGKGGTGKSSISSSLAFALAHTGYRTLLVDVDLFTHGLTFLNQARTSGRTDMRPLKNLFEASGAGKGADELSEQSLLQPTPLPIQSRYTGNNLSLLPSIRIESAHFDQVPMGHEPLELAAPYNELKPFARRLRDSLEKLGEAHDFDYIILDTRGGADHTSVGSALAAGAFILVTESDRPSWAISDRLLETVQSVREKTGLYSQALGYIINKNTLPSTQIESHLQKRWRMEHLGTLPYDVSVVRCFEQANIPMETDPDADFSLALEAMAKKLHSASAWEVIDAIRTRQGSDEAP